MNGKQLANFAVCLVVFGVIALGIKHVADAPDIAAAFNPEVPVSSKVLALEKQVVLNNYQFAIDQVTKQVRAVFEITNNSQTAIYDVKISCDLQDRSGELRGRGLWVVYDSLEPGHSGSYVLQDRRYISDLVTPESIVCKITDMSNKGVEVASGSTGH